jgi:hypothetical protein
MSNAPTYDEVLASSEATKPTVKDYFAGVFTEEAQILSVTKAAYDAGQPIHDCFTPYPVHNLDVAQGLKRSWITYAAFVWAALGLFLAISLQVHTQFVDFTELPLWKGWPIIIGGKPFLPWPAFVPVFFELTVLCCGHLTVLTLLVSRGLLPGMQPKIHIDGVTDDRFAIVLDPEGEGYDEAAARALFEQHGATDVFTVEGRI